MGPSESQAGPSSGRLGKLKATWRGLTKGTIFSSIFTLLTTCIGAGTLSLPYAFAQGGLIPSSSIFFLIMIVSIIVGFLLFSAKRYCEELYPKMPVWGYEDLALLSFGAVGKVKLGIHFSEGDREVLVCVCVCVLGGKMGEWSHRYYITGVGNIVFMVE